MATQTKEQSKTQPERLTKDVYTRVTERIIADLEQGIRTWMKPWAAEHAAGRITKPLRHNGTPYRGMNILLLWGEAVAKGYSVPIWMTFKQLPLPFGTKSRLILIYLDTFAVLNQSPEVDIEHSMTAFLKKLQGYSPNGKELAAFKDHASALTGSLFRFAMAQGDRTFQIDTKIVTSFQLWYPKDERQNTLWPSYIRLSDEYFKTLVNHAVPLDYRAVGALHHNALALDIYKWLAQRQCRVPANKPAFIPWPAVQLQFGQGYGRIRDFRAIFQKTLKIVKLVYAGAETGVKADGRGLTLHLSAPPIAKLLK